MPASFLINLGRSLWSPRRVPAVGVQIGQEIEVGVARVHLEADTGRKIAVVDQHAVPQDAMDEIDRGAIEDQEIHRSAEELFHAITECTAKSLQGGRRWRRV